MGRLDPLSRDAFDALIIGGGIHGATLADACARAGLRTALVEQGDYGAEASANSLKILHGGLRYLQQANLPRMRESILARRETFIRFPHLARPARFIAPTGPGLKKSVLAYQVAARLNDLVSADRNAGVPLSHTLPPTRVLSVAALPHLPESVRRTARHALCWHDGFIENTERLTLEHVLAARRLGACCFNYAQATELLRRGNRIEGARVCDADDGSEVEVRAAITINAAGHWISALTPPELRPPDGAPCVRAWNLFVRKRWFGGDGVGLEGRVESPSGPVRRNFFFAPWRTGTLIGTMYEPFDPGTGPCALSAGDIGRFVREINQIFPEAGLTTEDVVFTHVGTLPAKTGAGGIAASDPASATRIADGLRYGIEGFVVLQGVKYTTAPILARTLASRLARRLGRRTPAQPAAEGPAAPPANPAPLPDTSIPLSSLREAIAHEQAVHLDDLVFRRTDLGSAGWPKPSELNAVARFMAESCHWDESRLSAELKRVEQHYRRLGLPPH